MSFFKNLKDKISHKTTETTEKFKGGLSKTRTAFIGKVDELINRFHTVDEEFFEELEDVLISADMGVETVMGIVDELREETKKHRIERVVDFQPLLSETLMERLTFEDTDRSLHVNPNGLTVIMFVGVNGVGKTTTMGKMAHMFQQEGKKVLMAAGDTFRAGAIEQLEVWGERVNTEVIKHQSGSDPAAVVYDSIQAAKSRGTDVLLCDTAGRLQNKVNLMEELKKVRRVMQRELPDAPHEVLLVLDATTGQNALQQAKIFKEAVDVTGIALTKLDGTAKGGIILAIKNELQIPVKYVGLGEKMDDLQPFDPEQFVHAVFADLVKNET